MDNDSHAAFTKVLLVWVAAVLSSITLSKLLMLATLIYTVAQFYFLMRDKWWRDRK